MFGFLRNPWQKWLKFAAVLGNIQITIILSLIYWTVLLPWALPYRVFSDRLALRNPQKVYWIKRAPGTDWLKSMRKQG